MNLFSFFWLIFSMLALLAYKETGGRQPEEMGQGPMDKAENNGDPTGSPQGRARGGPGWAGGPGPGGPTSGSAS